MGARVWREKIVYRDTYWREVVPFYEYFHGDDEQVIRLDGLGSWRGCFGCMTGVRARNDLGQSPSTVL